MSETPTPDPKVLGKISEEELQNLLKIQREYAQTLQHIGELEAQKKRMIDHVYALDHQAKTFNAEVAIRFGLSEGVLPAITQDGTVLLK